MTAFPSAIPESTAAEQRAHEPSMEEILASIRKIISDDQMIPLSTRPVSAAPELRPEPRPSVAPAVEPDLERLRAAAAPRPPVDFSGSFASGPPARPQRPEPRVAAEIREISARSAAPAPRLVVSDEGPLVSDRVDQAVQSSFQTLNAARSLSNPQAVEAMARDLLRPMLKEWLDENLPSMVERLVRAEIERVVRGR